MLNYRDIVVLPAEPPADANELGLIETLAVVDDEHGRPVEVELDDTGINLRCGITTANLSPAAALRIASAMMLAVNEATIRREALR